jgi:hypothetical protein
VIADSRALQDPCPPAPPEARWDVPAGFSGLRLAAAYYRNLCFLSSRRASFFAEVVTKKFLVAFLIIIALSGAVGALLVAYRNSAAAHEEPPISVDWVDEQQLAPE